MTDAQIREAACLAYDAAKQASGSWLDGFEAIYRAGLEAGRAEARAEAAQCFTELDEHDTDTRI